MSLFVHPVIAKINEKIGSSSKTTFLKSLFRTKSSNPIQKLLKVFFKQSCSFQASNLKNKPVANLSRTTPWTWTAKNGLGRRHDYDSIVFCPRPLVLLQLIQNKIFANALLKSGTHTHTYSPVLKWALKANTTWHRCANVSIECPVW